MWWPWASAVWGEVQFELMMAILWENMAEPCSFGPQRPPPFPIGQYTSKAVQKSLAWPLLHNFCCRVSFIYYWYDPYLF